MGLTLIAIVTAAMLLPGIIAARAFYLAGQTREIEVPVPPLSTPNGIALIGAFSVVVHTAYVLCLKLISSLPPLVTLPIANPYVVFDGSVVLQKPLDAALAFFSGLLFVSVLAFCTGIFAGRIMMRRADKSLFYGPLADVIASANGDDKFITAYVVSKIADGNRLVGYEGTVDSLYRDSDRFPSKVVLKDVVPFYLRLSVTGPIRMETNQLIDWLVLSSSDWHNIAFRVFQLVNENPSQDIG